MKKSLVCFLMVLTSCPLVVAKASMDVESERQSFRIVTLIDGLSRPWGMAFLPEGGVLVTERTGTLLLIRGGGAVPVIGGPDVEPIGQGGLLDVVLSPSYRTDALIYLAYSEAGAGGYGTAVARGRLAGAGGSSPRLESLEVIYRATPRSPGGRHFGSRLVFNEGRLFITLGDRGGMNRAQDTGDPYGSVLRLNPDGSIPTDNPFASHGADPGGGLPEIWSYGHRNAQGMAVHPETGDIWLNEHGPKGGDEVNILRPGANYGWPTVTYGIDYDGSIISDRTTAPGITEPVIYWDPSIAPSGMAFYEGEVFPKWSGNVFVGALAGRHLRRLEIRNTEVIHQEVLLHNRIGRIRDVRTGPDGLVYILTDANSGGLFRLEPVEALSKGGLF